MSNQNKNLFLETESGEIKKIEVDINQDGQIDIAVAAKSADVVVWYQNNGSGSSWTKHEIASDYDCAMSVFPSDIDADGDWDILSVKKLQEAGVTIPHILAYVLGHHYLNEEYQLQY